MLILNLLNLVSYMKPPRLPAPPVAGGITYFGIATAGYSAYVAHQEKKKNEDLSKENEQLKSDVKEARQNTQEIKQKLEDTTKKVDTLKHKLDNISQNLNDLISKANKYINNFSIISFQDLKDLFNKYMDYLGSFDLQEQILIFNSLNSFFLLSLLSSFLFNKYGNFLITKFKLVEKYPRIYRLFYYRSQVQKYYFMYISFLAITSLIFNLFINLSILLT